MDAARALILCLLFLGLPGIAVAQEAVEMYEREITIPTYLVEEPEVNPVFYTGRAYQGAQGRVYPYALDDRLTDELVEEEYTALYLENEFVQVVVLPERGGKFYIGKDKTNDYDFIYRNDVIKPALIGMLGAWTSGGVEWNIPHHHRATADMPVDYVLKENDDGSKTIWIGETERRHRTHWVVGLTLHPGRSDVEADLRLYNRTPLANSLLMWANTAVHANEDYQVIFPPSTQHATYHSKREMTTWPVSEGEYLGIDFAGTDISWWKSHPRGVSFFAWNYEDDFVAGYDHGREAGLAIVADHNVAPGKKLWNWGTEAHAQLWYDILTDENGPYLEIMTGAYSDNQPDYSWAAPFVRKQATMHFFPLREIGAVKEANTEAAVNIEKASDNSVAVGINTTQAHQGAKVALLNGTEVIHEQSVQVSPASPFTAEIDLPAGVDPEQVAIRVTASDGSEIISYGPVERDEEPTPETVKPPQAPADIESIEELYLVGLRLDQFHNPGYTPYPYFDEALRRDPGYAPVNTHLGILYLKRGMFEEAEEHLRRAVERVTQRETRAKDTESLYYLGFALLEQGKDAEAKDLLNRAAWSHAWYSPAHTMLARIEAREGDYERALHHVEEALSANTRNVAATHLKSALLRTMDRVDEARTVAEQLVDEAPLYFPARYETALLSGAGEAAAMAELREMMRDEVENYLELATDYANAGLYSDAVAVLSEAAETEATADQPLVYYHRGYFSELQGDRTQAQQDYRHAASLSTDYVFPYRFETAWALQSATEANPADARAHLYLGNLYYDNQPEEAMTHWQRAVEIDGSLAQAHRNLGFGFAYSVEDPDRALAAMERAMELRPDDPRYYYETDLYAEWTAESPADRLARMEGHDRVIARHDAAGTRHVALLINGGRYDRAIDIMMERHFRRAEGAEGIHDMWVDAHLLRGQQRLASGDADAALADFETALTYPKNLEVAVSNREGEAHYYRARALEAMGRDADARDALEEVASADNMPAAGRYLQALALRELERDADADRIFSELVDRGRRGVDGGGTPDFFAKFGGEGFEAGRRADAYYLMGLGHLGRGESSEATAAFREALSLDPGHLGASVQLGR